MYAIVQKNLEVPAVHKLKLAFTGVPGLVPADAHTIANDAFGILLKNLSAEDARRVAANLRAHGIDTEIVLETALPAMPPCKSLQRLSCLEDTLLIYDPVGQPLPVPWTHVILVASGYVRVHEFTDRTPKERLHFKAADALRGLLAIEDDIEPAATMREERNFRLFLEIYLSGARMRFQLRPETFNFVCLGDRQTDQVLPNLQLFIDDLARLAPHLVLNRGAADLRAGSATIQQYPSKNAFYEEITWLLWHMLKS